MGVTHFSGIDAGELYIAGVKVTDVILGLDGITATAEEINVLDDVVAGTASASKAAVLGANKNLDTLVLPVSGLKIGSGAGTAVTASAAELNKLTGSGAKVASGTQVSHITDAKVDYIDDGSENDLDTDAKRVAAMNATNAKINLILDALDAFGITA